MSKAAYYLLLATLLFTTLNVCVKFLPHIPTVELVFFRGLVTLVLCYISIWKMGISHWGVNKKILIARGFCGTVSLYCLFYSLQHMPIAMAMTLSNLSPLFTVLIAHFVLRERAHWSQALFLVIAFAGVLLVKGWSPDISWWLAIIGLSGAFFAACAYSSVRALRISEHPMVVIFYFPLISTPLTFAPMLREWVRPSLQDWALIGLVGVLTQFAQYYMTKAYQMEKASSVMIYNYAGIIWAVLVGWLIFQETFTAPQFAGLALILGCLIASALVARKTPPI